MISINKNTGKEYENAIRMVGGVAYAAYLPEVLHSFSPSVSIKDFCTNLSNEYDRLILGGGGDINPIIYHEPLSGSIRIDDNRDAIEFQLIEAFTKLKKPIMGICRGLQVMNVALGGTIVQDDGKACNSFHTTPDMSFQTHDTYCNPSIFQQLYGSCCCVNSHHHQSIKKLADGLIVTQYTPEEPYGYCIEGVVHKSYPFVGVQWHPERLCNPHPLDKNCVDETLIFDYFLSLH